MRTQITARHFQATPELRDYATKRIEKLTRFYDGITDVHVILSETSGPPKEKSAEVSLSVYRQLLSAGDTGTTHEEALDRCTDRLKRQVIRYKAKLKDTNKNSHR